MQNLLVKPHCSLWAEKQGAMAHKEQTGIPCQQSWSGSSYLSNFSPLWLSAKPNKEGAGLDLKFIWLSDFIETNGISVMSRQQSFSSFRGSPLVFTRLGRVPPLLFTLSSCNWCWAFWKMFPFPGLPWTTYKVQGIFRKHMLSQRSCDDPQINPNSICILLQALVCAHP